MKKIWLIHTLIFTLFCALILTISIGKSRSSNFNSILVPNTYENEKPIDENDIKLSYYIDPKKNLTPYQLPEEEFIPSDCFFSPGFYDGVLWLDIYFPESTATNIDAITFGSEPLDFAELFIYNKNQWLFAGRTGRSISTEQTTYPSCFQAIPFNESDFKNDSGVIHARVKMLSQLGSPVNISIMPKRLFTIRKNFHNTLNYFLIGIFIVILLYNGIFALLFRDLIYSHLSIAGLIELLLIFQLTGIGPCSIWNTLSTLPNSYKLVYILSELVLLSLSVVFIFSLKEKQNKHKSFKHLMILSMSMFVIFLCSIFIPSAKICFYIFTTTSTVSSILLTISMIVYKPDKNKLHKNFIYFWIPGLLLLILRQCMHFFNLEQFLMYKIFNNDYYYPIILSFILINLPFLFNSTKRVREKFVSMTHTIRNQKNNIDNQKEKLSFYSDMTNQVMSLNTVILNTIKLPKKNEVDYLKENLALIERTAYQQENILRSVSTLIDKTSIIKHNINIQSFVKNTFNLFPPISERRSVELTLSLNIPENYIIYESTNLLEILFFNFIFSGLKYSPLNTKLRVSVKMEDDTFIANIKNNQAVVFQEDYEETHREASDYFNQNLLKKILEYFEGKFESNTESLTMDYTFKIDFSNSKIKDNLVFFSNPEDSGTYQDALSTKKENLVKDEVFAIDGKIPTIMIVESDPSSLILIDKILSPHCYTLDHSSGVDAWNHLKEPSNKKPDLILSEYHLPNLSGIDLLRKCTSDEDLSTIPFMFIFPDIETQRFSEVIRKGASTVITKPFVPESLINRIYAVLYITANTRRKIMKQIHMALNDDIPTSSQAIPKAQINYSDSAPVPNKKQDVYLSQIQASIFASYDLSKREQEIVLLILTGNSDKQIAEKLGISAATVASHNKKIFKKLEVHSRIELMSKIR